MPKFKLLAGVHIENKIVDGNPVEVVYRRNDVFESPIELDERFNSHNSFRFQRLYDEPGSDLHKKDVEAANKRAETEASRAQQASSVLAKSLARMSVRELQSLAEEEEVNIAGLTKREDIVTAILNATVAAQ